MPGNSKPTIHFDEFVQAARPNVKETNPLVFVQGYIGKSPVANCVRIYTDPSLNEYVDVPSADIVHSIKVEDDPLGLGGSMLWVKIPTSDDKVAKSYLEGNLYGDYLKKIYDQEGTTTRKGEIGQITDFTRTLATDITRPTFMTDITKTTFMTDITRVTRLRTLILNRYYKVGTRACPPWGFSPGNFATGVDGYYY